MRNRSQLIVGLLLILAGAWLITTRQVPDLQNWLDKNFEWPMYMIAGGAALLLIGLFTGNPGTAVPAAVIAGIGGILYYQNQSNDWDSWAYMWALIPGFVGVGTVLASILGDEKSKFMNGVHQVIVSAGLFLVFSSFFGGIKLLGSYGPAAILIVLGIYIIARGSLRKE